MLCVGLVIACFTP
ncbi:hypothetical protein MTR11_23945 [Vibrio sp. CCB-PB317]|nr:hypothetical protein [Vibrio diabolicus]MCJ0881840.1 hypothetical protein [Vibrio sp. CCB-PB317]MCJ0884710.1 hypothetical protein [Vibrio sp. CCB-PB317]